MSATSNNIFTPSLSPPPTSNFCNVDYLLLYLKFIGKYTLPYKEITIVVPKGDKRELVAVQATKMWIEGGCSRMTIALK